MANEFVTDTEEQTFHEVHSSKEVIEEEFRRFKD
jgi:hypothetical protein